jgi:hypothetical protein
MVQTNEERKAKQKEYDAIYRKTPEVKAKQKESKKKYRKSSKGKIKEKEYSQRPEVKAKQKEYSQRPEVKAKQKEYSQRPEVKAKQKEYNSRPEVKAKRKEYQSTPEYKAKQKEYDSRPEVKAKQKEYSQRPEVKAKQKEYDSRPEVKLRKIEQYQYDRLIILQTYSKRLSNSDVPCCICCGENFHSDFLAIDHIAGRKQMDSEPELVKIGYSSKLLNHQLIKWIIENNFPSGFQILCANCNFAKGMKKNNNECPMKNKPH